jgi:hypothetical protein
MTQPKRAYPRPPDLQSLVAEFGSYAAIPEWAWSDFDKAMGQWQRERREHTAGHVIDGRKAKPPKKKRSA